MISEKSKRLDSPFQLGLGRSAVRSKGTDPFRAVVATGATLQTHLVDPIKIVLINLLAQLFFLANRDERKFNESANDEYDSISTPRLPSKSQIQMQSSWTITWLL